MKFTVSAYRSIRERVNVTIEADSQAAAIQKFGKMHPSVHAWEQDHPGETIVYRVEEAK